MSNCDTGVPSTRLIFKISRFYVSFSSFLYSTSAAAEDSSDISLTVTGEATACAIFSLDKLRLLPIASEVSVPDSWWCCTHTNVAQSEQNAMNTWYNVPWYDVYCYYSSSVDHREVFSNIPTLVSNHLFLLWSKNVWIRVLKILHRMSKNILSGSLIDQQYRTLCNTFIISDHLWKHCPTVIRSTVHRFHCWGGFIFLEGDYIEL